MADIVNPGESPEGKIGMESIPNNVDIVLYQGDDFSLDVSLVTEQDIVIPLDGFTAKCQFRRTYEAESAIEALVTIDSDTSVLNVFVSNEITSLMSGDYIYDLEVTDPNGRKKTYLAGDVHVVPEVTR
jgi:hypothetical protein